MCATRKRNAVPLLCTYTFDDPWRMAAKDRDSQNIRILDLDQIAAVEPWVKNVVCHKVAELGAAWGTPKDD